MTDFFLKYSDKYYVESKQDLATIFLQRIQSLLKKRSSLAIVSPHNWLTIKTYIHYRKLFLNNFQINTITHLGSGAFSQISGEVVNVILLISSLYENEKKEVSFIGIDSSNNLLIEDKKNYILKGELVKLSQENQKKNPDFRIILESLNEAVLLSKYADSIQGLVSGDNYRLSRNFWEFPEFLCYNNWILIHGSNSKSILYNGLDRVFNYENDGASLARKQGLVAWGHKGVTVNVTGNLFSSIYMGYAFASDIATIIPKEKSNLLPIFEYCSSKDFYNNVRKIDKKLGVTNATLVKVPFDLEYWKNIALENYPNGFPKPYSDDATQWLFHGHAVKADNPLHVSIARLLGHRWPAESDDKMELADEAKELIKSVKVFDEFTDDDGIMCIPSVNGELAGAERLRTYLQAVYGAEYNNDTIAELLKKEGSKKSNLEDWLRDEFFDHHCKLFQNRPFIWQIWDGRKDGFSVLVNYHKLNKDNLQKVIYTYLGDWTRQCEMKVKSGDSGADGLLTAAKKLKEKLELILEGEAPYDIFVRWKKLDEQPIGWDPDLNDGVRLNIRPFMNAYVLKKKPNIKWGVDRGKNPPGTPWGEIRDNDKHLTLAEKRTARDNKK